MSQRHETLLSKRTVCIQALAPNFSVRKSPQVTTFQVEKLYHTQFVNISKEQLQSEEISFVSRFQI